jgi:starch phosphorylase
MSQLTMRFSAARAVREYTAQFYAPGATAFQQRAAAKGELAEQIVVWRRTLMRHWEAVRFGDVSVSTDGGRHLIEVQVYLDGLEPGMVQVELHAEGIGGSGPERHEMTPLRGLVSSEHAYAYGAQVSANRPAADYSARIMPKRAGVAVPLEADNILWQH